MYYVRVHKYNEFDSRVHPIQVLEELPSSFQHKKHRCIGWNRPHEAWCESAVEPPPAAFMGVQCPSTVYYSLEPPFCYYSVVRLQAWLDDISRVCQEPIQKPPCTTRNQQPQRRHIMNIPPFRDECCPHYFVESWKEEKWSYTADISMTNRQVSAINLLSLVFLEILWLG